MHEACGRAGCAWEKETNSSLRRLLIASTSRGDEVTLCAALSDVSRKRRDHRLTFDVTAPFREQVRNWGGRKRGGGYAALICQFDIARGREPIGVDGLTLRAFDSA